MNDKITTRDAKAQLRQSLQDLCNDFNSGRFSPILEADVSAFIYHRLITNGCEANTAYLATRICGEAERSRKPDIVIGTLNKSQACIKPVLICELKVFQRWGHSDQQMRQRISGILSDDIPTLAELSSDLPLGRIEIVVDLYTSAQLQGYMTGTWHGESRIEVVARECKKVGASLFWIRDPDGAGSINVEEIL
ncbi:MAG: hypothetical protein QGD96_12870 [Anaerolineae bacterium]|nr:hypothetical protein [Anaerolineae bacterium]